MLDSISDIDMLEPRENVTKRETIYLRNSIMNLNFRLKSQVFNFFYANTNQMTTRKFYYLILRYLYLTFTCHVFISNLQEYFLKLLSIRCENYLSLEDPMSKAYNTILCDIISW